MTRAAAARARPGLERRGPKGKLDAAYHHAASGWTVRHCGHPTANWPYYATRQDEPAMLLTGGLGRGLGFRTVLTAQLAVELVAASGHLHRDACYVDPPGGATPYLRCGHPPLWDHPAW